MRRLGLALLASMALIGSAAAADMPAKMVTKAPIVAPPFSWTGFYVGGNAGYSWGRQCNSLTDPTGAILFGNSNCDRLNGFIGGGQLGYNWQYNQWVLGLEGVVGRAQKATARGPMAAENRNVVRYIGAGSR